MLTPPINKVNFILVIPFLSFQWKYTGLYMCVLRNRYEYFIKKKNNNKYKKKVKIPMGILINTC